MRVLFVTASSGSTGGGELYMLYLAQELKALGCVPILWCSDHESLDKLSGQFAEVGDVFRSRYVNTFRRRLRSLSHALSGGDVKRYRSEWTSLRPDVIHFNKQCLEDGLDLLAAAKGLTVPHCATIHITQTARELKAVMPGIRDAVARRSLRQYTGDYIAISDRRTAELKRFVGEGKRVHHIDNGVSVPSDEERLRLREDGLKRLGVSDSRQLTVVAVGRLEAQKRPLLFVEMAEALHKQVPEAQFYWVGGGRMQAEWDEAVSSRNAGSYIHCLGWQDNVLPFLAAADLFLHPAAYEGLPFALLEAMAWKLPCVIQPELADELGFNEVDFLAVARGSQWLQEAADADWRETTGARAQAMIKQRFSRLQMAQRHLDVYRGLTPSTRPSPAAL